MAKMATSCVHKFHFLAAKCCDYLGATPVKAQINATHQPRGWPVEAAFAAERGGWAVIVSKIAIIVINFKWTATKQSAGQLIDTHQMAATKTKAITIPRTIAAAAGSAHSLGV